jgi:hypothetical protein
LKMKQILFVDKTSLQLTDMSFPFGRPRWEYVYGKYEKKKKKRQTTEGRKKGN